MGSVCTASFSFPLSSIPTKKERQGKNSPCSVIALEEKKNVQFLLPNKGNRMKERKMFGFRLGDDRLPASLFLLSIRYRIFLLSWRKASPLLVCLYTVWIDPTKYENPNTTVVKNPVFDGRERRHRPFEIVSNFSDLPPFPSDVA